jgi:hypothetical protein
MSTIESKICKQDIILIYLSIKRHIFSLCCIASNVYCSPENMVEESSDSVPLLNFLALHVFSESCGRRTRSFGPSQVCENSTSGS